MGSMTTVEAACAVTAVVLLGIGIIHVIPPVVRSIAGIRFATVLVCVFPANACATKRSEQFGRIAAPFWAPQIVQIVLVARELGVGLAS